MYGNFTQIMVNWMTHNVFFPFSFNFNVFFLFSPHLISQFFYWKMYSDILIPIILNSRKIKQDLVDLLGLLVLLSNQSFSGECVFEKLFYWKLVKCLWYILFLFFELKKKSAAITDYLTLFFWLTIFLQKPRPYTRFYWWVWKKLKRSETPDWWANFCIQCLDL